MLMSKEQEGGVAVYFIRPDTTRPKGISDSPVKIEYNNQLLLSLAKGEFAYVRLRESKGDIRVKSLTLYTGNRLPVELERTLRVEFESGATYYVMLSERDEEFRGVYAQPELVDLDQAQVWLTRLRAVSDEPVPIAAR